MSKTSCSSSSTFALGHTKTSSQNHWADAHTEIAEFTSVAPPLNASRPTSWSAWQPPSYSPNLGRGCIGGDRLGALSFQLNCRAWDVDSLIPRLMGSKVIIMKCTGPTSCEPLWSSNSCLKKKIHFVKPSLAFPRLLYLRHLRSLVFMQNTTHN